MSNFLLHGPAPIVHIHIPKTGGSTIRLGLWGKDKYTGPVFGDVPEDWRSHWSFMMVRHPMERWWSAWRDFNFIRGFKSTPDEFAKITICEDIPWVGFDGTREGHIRHHTAPITAHEAVKRADKVYRYPDEYDVAVREVLLRAGRNIPETFPRLRETPKTDAPKLSPDVEEALRGFYKADSEAFGFSL